MEHACASDKFTNVIGTRLVQSFFPPDGRLQAGETG
jgi:hypothetical protein